MRALLALGIVVLSTACGQFVTAQPPERRDGLRDALDTNGDHELDADEIKNASASLAKADRNGDGKIDHEEFRPPLPPTPRGEGGPRPQGGPSPERFAERAMTFDADGDGKLDRTEVEKFAGEMMQRLRGGMAERGTGPAGERGGGFRPGDGPRRRPDTAEGTESGERPERPRRPE